MNKISINIGLSLYNAIIHLTLQHLISHNRTLPPKVHKEAHDIKLDRIIHHSFLSSMLNESDESSYGRSLLTEAERASYKARERLALHVLQEMATMLHSMHESGYVHGDIKGDNIMVSPPSSAESHQKSSSQTATTQQDAIGGGGRVQGEANEGAYKDANNKGTAASCPASYYTISLIDLGHTVKMGKTSCD